MHICEKYKSAHSEMEPTEAEFPSENNAKLKDIFAEIVRNVRNIGWNYYHYKIKCFYNEITHSFKHENVLH